MAVGDNSLDAHVGGLKERLDDFLGQVLGKVGKDVLDVLADVPAARRQGLKAKQFLPINLHRLREHLLGTDPHAVLAVLLPVNNEFF